jgi:hypothetical protein
MLTFLAPAAWIGLALLAIPILVHLLKPRKVRRTPFSSLRWLDITEQRLSRRMRWHQLPLFLLRAAFIALLVAAIARPFWRNDSAAGPVDRYLVIDTSRSMGYRAGEEVPTPLDRAKARAEELLRRPASGRTAVLAAGARTTIVGPLSRDVEAYAAPIRALGVDPVDPGLGATLDVVRTVSQAGGQAGSNIGGPISRPVELVILTDNQQTAWHPEAIEKAAAGLPAHSRVTVIDVGEPTARNAWIADARLSIPAPAAPGAIVAQIGSSGLTEERSVRLVGVPSLENRPQKISLDPTRATTITFELPAGFDVRGKVAQVVLEPADGLPDDDRRFVPLEPEPALRVLVIEGPTAAGAAASPGFALRTAVEALSAEASPIGVTAKAFNEVDVDDLADVDVVIWADAPELPDAVLERLAERVRDGAGLALFTGPATSSEFLNARLIDPLDAGKSLLPARLERVVDVPAADGGLIAYGNFAAAHPLFAGLLDPSLGDLGRTGVRSYFKLTAPPAGLGATVLAATAGAPAIVERTVGNGKVLLFNVSADDAWSDLPRRKSFVPLVDRMLEHLAGGVVRRSFVVGRPIGLAVAASRAGEPLTLEGPTGVLAAPTATRLGSRTLVRIPPQSAAGVYRLRGTAPKAAATSPATAAEPAETLFVVQPAGAGSISRVDDENLRAWWGKTPLEIVRGDTAAAVASAGGSDRPLVPWLAAAAVVLLLVETLVTYRLCPRMNPEQAQSIVRRRTAPVSPGAASHGAPANPPPPGATAHPAST